MQHHPYTNPLFDAIRDKNLVDVATLLRSGQHDDDEELTQALVLASDVGLSDACVLLYTRGATADLNRGDALSAAIRAGHPDVVDTLLKYRIVDILDENQASEDALHLAAGEGNADIVRHLLQHGADPNRRSDGPFVNCTPLHAARRAAVAEALINAGADVNAAAENGFMPLHAAMCVIDDPTLVAVLIENGADPNAVQTESDDYGTTPLMEAVFYGNVDAIRRLVAANANVSLREPMKGYDALDIAMRYGRYDIALILLELGAQLHAASLSHMMVGLNFVMACRGDAFRTLLDLILAKGFDINKTDENGLTPFLLVMKAAVPEWPRFSRPLGEEIEIIFYAIERLIEAGANAHAVDTARNSGLHLLARNCGSCFPTE